MNYPTHIVEDCLLYDVRDVFAARDEVATNCITEARFIGAELKHTLPVSGNVCDGIILVLDQDLVSRAVGSSLFRPVPVVYRVGIHIADVLGEESCTLLPGMDVRAVAG